MNWSSVKDTNWRNLRSFAQEMLERLSVLRVCLLCLLYDPATVVSEESEFISEAL